MMLSVGWSDTGKNVCADFHLPKTAANYTDSAYICNRLSLINCKTFIICSVHASQSWTH